MINYKIVKKLYPELRYFHMCYLCTSTTLIDRFEITWPHELGGVLVSYLFCHWENENNMKKEEFIWGLFKVSEVSSHRWLTLLLLACGEAEHYGRRWGGGKQPKTWHQGSRESTSHQGQNINPKSIYPVTYLLLQPHRTYLQLPPS